MVASVLAVTRAPLGKTHPKLREIRRKDFFDYCDLSRELETIDACFFCLGVSSVGMNEADYYHLTYDLTLSAASALAAAHPNATFCYVSGEGTDSSERGRRMWARQHRQRGHPLRPAVGDDPRQAAAPIVPDEMKPSLAVPCCPENVERVADQFVDPVVVENRRIGAGTGGISGLVGS